MKEQNEIKIGLEIHVQLNTKSKLFCSCSTSLNKPNSSVCPICLGLPGSKPSLNIEAINFAIKLALALNCKIMPEMFFSRKNYFYPDLAKNFQITQYDFPLARDGYLKVNDSIIRIRRIQLEEDPASSQHPSDITGSDYVLVDYNRSGIPLCEIVTEPDFKSVDEVRDFLENLLLVLNYIKIYDSKLFKLRVDANISIQGREKVEIKNITGFKAVEKALRFEIIRQRGKLARGELFVHETRHYDIVSNTTKTLRLKEVEEEYGYIFEPDLVKFEISDHIIKSIKEGMPELPQEKIARLVQEYGISKHQAFALALELELANMFEIIAKKVDKILVAKWLTGPLKKILNYNKINFSDTNLTEKQIIDFLDMVRKEEVTPRSGELILRKLVIKPQDPRKLAAKLKLLKILDLKEVEKIVREILKQNKKAINDYKSGEEKALQFLIGQVVKKTSGRADAKLVHKLIKKSLEIT